MTAQPKHTPGPWELHAIAGEHNSLRICKPSPSLARGCRVIAEAEILGLGLITAQANAAFIVRACNGYDALLVAARQGQRLAGLICDTMVNGDLNHAPGCTADPCACWVASAPEARDALEAALAAAEKEVKAPTPIP